MDLIQQRNKKIQEHFSKLETLQEKMEEETKKEKPDYIAILKLRLAEIREKIKIANEMTEDDRNYINLVRLESDLLELLNKLDKSSIAENAEKLDKVKSANELFEEFEKDKGKYRLEDD